MKGLKSAPLEWPGTATKIPMELVEGNFVWHHVGNPVLQREDACAHYATKDRFRFDQFDIRFTDWTRQHLEKIVRNHLLDSLAEPQIWRRSTERVLK